MRRFLFLLVICATNSYCSDQVVIDNVLNYKPKEVYRKISGQEMNVFEKDVVCSICQGQCKPENDTNNNTNIVKTSCKHFFHEKCLNNWFNEKYTCPNCNKKLLVDDLDGVHGTMKIKKLENFCPGCKHRFLCYPLACRFLQINIKLNGYVYDNHFYEVNFEQTYFLPENKKGLILLGYYILAFRGRSLYKLDQNNNLDIKNKNPSIVLNSIKSKTSQTTDINGYSDNEETNNIWFNEAIDSIEKILEYKDQKNSFLIGKNNIGKVIKI